MPASDSTLLAQPGYVRFWLARLMGQLAMQIAGVALGWQMYELTNSAWDLGLVGLAQFLPSLVLVLPAGHAADRYHRGRILTGTLLLQAAAAVLLVAAGLGDWASRGWLLVASVLLGVARSFQMPALQTITPLLVPAGLLPKALATNASGVQMAVIIGPALGGALYASGSAVPYAACAIASLACALLVSTLPLAAAPRTTEPASWHTVLAGVRYIRERPVLLGAISLDLFAVLLGGATALLPIFAKEVLHTGPLGLGLLRGAPAGGALLMSLWLSRHPVARRAGPVLFASVAVYGVATLGFAVSTLMTLSLAMLALSGAADLVSVVIRQSMIQLDTPNEMRGRVSAVSSIFIGASNQLGEFESGATAAWLGPVGSVLLGGVGTLLVCAAWVRLFPALWGRDRLLATPPS